MSKSTGEITKSPKKRPQATGEPVLTRFQPPLLQQIDDWRRNQGDLPGRPEAIRRLVENALTNNRPPQSEASLDRKIAKQETAIAQMHQHSEPSPEAGMAAMDKAVAENDLIDMKNKRTRRKNAKRG
jgi:hypothetical protein